VKFLEHLALAIRSTAGSLLSGKPAARDTASLLASAQKRLDRLGSHLARAVEREQAADSAWRQALSVSAALEAETQAAAQGAADPAAALVNQERLRRAQASTRQLESACQDAARFSEKLRIEIADTQATLDQIRRRAGQPAPAPATAPQPPAAQAQPAGQAEQRPADLAAQPAHTPPADVPDQSRIADILSKRKPDQ
jgi:hypothetical protein